MARCGCSDTCTCDLSAGDGIDVSGTGSRNNPYRIRFNGSEVANQGLSWDQSAKRLNVRIGTGLGFDSSGNLISTGGEGGGGGRLGATVETLENQDRDIVGGAYGAGYLIKPQDLRRSYSYGAQQVLDFMHVPVRFLSDGMPVVFGDEKITSKTQVTQTQKPDRPEVEHQDGHRWGVLKLVPDSDPWKNADEGRSSNYWFGYIEENQYGATFLADVFREAGSGTVLVLELRFPDSPSARKVELFLTSVYRLISQFGLQQSVIVTTTRPTVPGNANTIDVLGKFPGIKVGPMVDDAEAIPAADIKPSWSWLFLSANMDRELLQEYVNLTGKHSILFTVNRQYLRNSLVNKGGDGETGVGAKGVLSGDPAYYAGGFPTSHALSGYKYRRAVSNWRTTVVEHGSLPPGDTDPVNAFEARRGWHKPSGADAAHFGPQMNTGAVGWTYYVLQGWMCPIPDAKQWSLDFTCPFPGGKGHLAVAFGIDTDHAFVDYSIEGTAPDPIDPKDKGYVFFIGLNEVARLVAYEPNGATELGTPQNMGASRNFRIAVNPKGIRITQLTAPGGTEAGVLYAVGTTPAQAHRGPYLHFGRMGNGEGWDGTFEEVMLSTGPTAPGGLT